MGLLVLVLLLILLPVWAAGHWVVGQYPAGNTAESFPSAQVTTTGLSLPEPSSTAANPPEDMASSSSVASASVAMEASDSADLESVEHQDRLIVERDRLARENEKLFAEQELASERLDQMTTDNALLSKQKQQLSEQKQLLSNQKQQLQSEMQSLQEQATTQADQLRSARSRLQKMEQQIVAMKQMSIAGSTKEKSTPTASPKPDLQRRWRSISGKVVPAKFEGLQGDVVLLSTRGKTFRVPLSKLIPEDRAIARELAK
jgi:hypothetical protein